MKKKTKKVWNEKLRQKQRDYRAGKIEVNETISMGRKIGQKRKNNITQDDLCSFSCPNCNNNIKDDIIRLRPTFYECRKCNERFCREEGFDEVDNWIAESGF